MTKNKLAQGEKKKQKLTLVEIVDDRGDAQLQSLHDNIVLAAERAPELYAKRAKQPWQSLRIDFSTYRFKPMYEEVRFYSGRTTYIAYLQDVETGKAEKLEEFNDNLEACKRRARDSAVAKEKLDGYQNAGLA